MVCYDFGFFVLLTQFGSHIVAAYGEDHYLRVWLLNYILAKPKVFREELKKFFTILENDCIYYKGPTTTTKVTFKKTVLMTVGRDERASVAFDRAREYAKYHWPGSSLLIKPKGDYDPKALLHSIPAMTVVVNDPADDSAYSPSSDSSCFASSDSSYFTRSDDRYSTSSDSSRNAISKS